MKDFWVFGDSFADSTGHSNDWYSLLLKEFNGNTYYNYYCPSRDIQTIMDTFYSNLYKIEDDSLVIIWLPSLARIRYPKNKSYFNELHESSYVLSNDDAVENLELFVHWPYDDFPNGTAKKELDFPFNTFDFNDLNRNNKVSYSYKTNEGQERIQHAINDGIGPVDFAKLLNANDATAKNWSRIFYSLKKFCKFEILFVSWTDEYSKSIVSGKTQLTKEIGLWHTQHDEYNETNGKSGNEWDEHFSTKMHKEFSDFIIKKYPKYFSK